MLKYVFLTVNFEIFVGNNSQHFIYKAKTNINIVYVKKNIYFCITNQYINKMDEVPASKENYYLKF